MRVLVTVASANRRGAELVGMDIAEGLAARGVAADAVALAPAFAGTPIDVEVLGAEPLALDTLRALRARAQDYDVVLAGGSSTLPACAVALAGTGVPFVYRSIGDPAFWKGDALRRARTLPLFHRASAIVALWPGAARTIGRAYGVPRHRLHVIANARPRMGFAPPTPQQRAAARAALGVAPDVPVALYLGSLSYEKEPRTAVQALSHAPGVHLLVAGDGPQRADLEAEAGQLAPGRVQFLGVRTDTVALLHAADVLVLTSRTEGIPGVAIEAALCARPVVATDVGGTTTVVLHGITGFLARPGQPAATGRFLRRAIADGARLGAAGARHVRREFQFERSIGNWERVLATAVRGDALAPFTPAHLAATLTPGGPPAPDVIPVATVGPSPVPVVGEAG